MHHGETHWNDGLTTTADGKLVPFFDDHRGRDLGLLLSLLALTKGKAEGIRFGGSSTTV